MQPLNTADAEYVLLGRIIGFYGVQGWVKVHSDTEPRDNIIAYSHWWLRQPSGWQQIKVVSGKHLSKNVIARLQGCDSREQAAAYMGLDIAVKRSDLPSLSEGEFYWADLIGCDVIDLQGVSIGSAVRLFETGANDVLVVKDTRHTDGIDREVLIPWLRPSVITEVDTANRRIVVDWDPDF